MDCHSGFVPLDLYVDSPMSGLLGFATEEIAARLGQVAGGLVNATFENAVELIVRKILISFSGYYSS